MAKMSAFDKAANLRERVNNMAEILLRFGDRAGSSLDDLQTQITTIEKRLDDIDSHLDYLATRLEVVESSSISYRARQFGAWVRGLFGGAR